MDALVANIFAAALTEDEIEALVRLASEVSGAGIRAISARLEGERRKRAKEEAKKSRDAALADIEAGGRLVRHRPRDDDELTPVVDYLDSTLAASDSDDPVVRSLDGWPRRIVYQPSAALHLLEPEDEEPARIERKPAPASPIIARHSVASLTMRIEREFAFVARPMSGRARSGCRVPLCRHSPSKGRRPCRRSRRW